MRILLAYAPHRDTFGYSMPPPGLLRLGGELERRGVEVELEDLAYRLAAGELHGDLIEASTGYLSARGEFDVIGFSVMGATLPAALLIARELHALRPETRLILGGPGTTGVDALVLERFPWVDAVVRGEAERTLPELLARWEVGTDLVGVAGVTWRAPDGSARREERRAPLADLADLAPYARHLLPPLVDYKRVTGESEGLTPLDSGRGCVFDCSFCTIGRFWDRRSRVLPADRLVQEVLELRDLDGARNAYLCHDIFGADRAHALAFCTALAEAGGAPWECRARVDHLDHELLDAMAAAGCYRVLLGIESGAASVRERCEKNLRGGVDVLEVVRACSSRGITPILSLILGLPGEGPAELEESLELCLRASLAAGVNLSLHLPNPQPGCGLGEEYGAAARPVDGVPPDMAFGAGETEAERALIVAHPDLFSTWSLLPGNAEELRGLAQLAKDLPAVLQRYPRTWAMLQRTRSESHVDLFRAWRASGLSFEGFVLSQRSSLCDAALRWEQALLRAAARGWHLGVPPSEEVVPRVRAERVELDHDLPAIAHDLDAGREPTLLRTATVLLVHPSPSGARTSRVGEHVHDVLDLLDDRRSLAELEADYPGVTGALRELADAGLVTFEAASLAHT